jgi:membrane protease YdiL (CAAX protease family)
MTSEPEVDRATEDTSPQRPPYAETLLIAIVGAAVLAFIFKYNLQLRSVYDMSPNGRYRTWDEYLLVNITLLVMPMMTLVLLVTRKPLSDYGVAASNRQGWVLTGWSLLAMTPLLLIASRYPVFQQFYPMQPMAGNSLPYLIYFEATYTFYLLTWEMFFRGFLTFGLARGMGNWPAILIQAVAFAILHIGKPLPEVAGSFVGGAALGWVALRSGSFVPCWIIHAVVSTAFNLLCIQARPGGLF